MGEEVVTEKVEVTDGSEQFHQKVQEILASEKMTDADKCIALHKLGYSRRSLEKDLGFSKSTIYTAMPVNPDHKDKDTEIALARTETVPMFRKYGAGVEVLNPEMLLREYMNDGERDEWELRGMMKLRAAMLLVMDLVNIQKTSAESESKRLEPLLKLLSVSREELDAATARAKNSSFEIAQVAANNALSGYVGEIDKRIPKAPPPKDMDEVFARPMGKMMDMMTDMMIMRMNPQKMNEPVEGWKYRTESSAQPASPAPAAADAPSGAGVATGWTTKTEEAKP